MNSIDVLFRTSRFNLSQVGKHFINPCCFGEDLAAWLRDRLAEKGVQASTPGQEDWGWYLRASYGTQGYFLGMSGNADGNSRDPNEGEWRIIVKKNRTIWQWLSGRGTIATDDAPLILVEQVLRSQGDLRDIRREDVGA